MKRFFASLLLTTCASFALAADEPRVLTLKEARVTALQKHPKITVAELKAMLASEAVREARSGFYPSVWGNVGAVGAADPNTRIVSSGLPVSSVFDRASASINLNQLVTDFGRTANLTDSAKLRARAEAQNAEAASALLLLQVDAAYFNGLQAEALLRVAEETVKSRQLLRDQVAVLASNQLKSELDASFAEIGLQEARLAQLKAENEVKSSFATLDTLIGSRDAETFRLVEEPLPGEMTNNVGELIFAALRDRPDLQRLRLERDGAMKFVKAERGLSYPSLSVQGAAGVVPYRASGLAHDYAAAGVILNIPLFSGNLYDARQREAILRARGAEATLQDEENNAVRDVRIAWLGASNARERLGVTAILLEQARKANSLAEARYAAGSSSIVELSQAQLNLTSAEITRASARYEYLVRRVILDYQTGKWR